MVTLQQAAQQALDLIEGNYVYLPEDRAYDTIAALRQALENEQQAEPVAWMFTVNGDEPRLHFFEPLAAHNVSDLKPLYTHPQQPLQADSVDSLTEGMTLGERIEHVGGRVNNSGYIEFGSTMAVDALIKQVLRDISPHPAQKPLTVEQIRELPSPSYGILNFVRAVERAHYITGETK